MIVQINFSLNVPVAEYERLCESVAENFATVPGLRWKVWLLDAESRQAGGIYLFDSKESADAFLSGPLIGQMKTLPAIRDISVKQFEVMAGVTALTRGPIGVAASR